MSDRREKILRPLITTSREFYPFVVALTLLTIIFLYAYMVQLSEGLGVTGLNDITLWGVYIVNFIFFIGLSHAGIAISAGVRILKLDRYAPIARMAEVLTLASLMMAGLSARAQYRPVEWNRHYITSSYLPCFIVLKPSIWSLCVFYPQ